MPTADAENGQEARRAATIPLQSPDRKLLLDIEANDESDKRALQEALALEVENHERCSVRLAERESQLTQERAEHEAALADEAAAATRAALSSNSPGSARLRARYKALKISVNGMVTTINTERQWRVAAETRVTILESSGVEMAADLAAEREARSAAGDEVAALTAELDAARKPAVDDSATPGPEGGTVFNGGKALSPSLAVRSSSRISTLMRTVRRATMTMPLTSPVWSGCRVR